MPNVQGIRAGTYLRTRNTSELQKVFVYGTLKKGFGNHERLLKDCKDLGNAHIDGLMFHLGCFPAINLSESFTKIIGEIYEVTWDKMQELDQLEGVDHNFYNRIQAYVKPQGLAWMYIFPKDRAAKEQFLIPGGVWRGPDTPKVKWGGFGKGVEIGSFMAHPSTEEIQVGPGDGPYTLRRSHFDSTYKLIHKETGEIIGSYKHLRDMVGTDGRKKPVLSLPAEVRSPPPPPTTTTTAVKEALQQHPSMPIVWSPHYVSEGGRLPISPSTAPIAEPVIEEPIPQAARLLGIKYGAA